MKIVEIHNKEIFYLLPENQLLEKGLRQVKILSIFETIWDSYAEKAINLLFESAVENLTCAMLLDEEKAILPLAQLYSKGTIYGILPDLVFSDYIILLGRKLGYEICNDIPLQLITNTKYFDKQLEDLAIIITSNTLFYYSNFRCIGEDIKKIMRDCNKQFKEEWHFCKFEYPDLTFSSFEILEEEQDSVTVTGETLDANKCLMS